MVAMLDEIVNGTTHTMMKIAAAIQTNAPLIAALSYTSLTSLLQLYLYLPPLFFHL